MCVHRTNRCESKRFALVSIEFSMCLLLLIFTALVVIAIVVVIVGTLMFYTSLEFLLSCWQYVAATLTA